MINAWHIFWHVKPVLSSILVVLQPVLHIARTIINVMTKDMWDVRLVYILIVKGIVGSYMTFQWHWSIKLMIKTLLSKSTTGDITSKHWHFIVLMFKMISKLQLYLYSYFTGTMYCLITYHYCNFIFIIDFFYKIAFKVSLR